MSDTDDTPRNWQYRFSDGEEPPPSDAEVLAMMGKNALIRLAETRAQMVHQFRGLSAADSDCILFWKGMATTFAAEIKRLHREANALRDAHATEVRELNRLLLEARAATAPRKERKARRGR